jgi:hypothetical protein
LFRPSDLNGVAIPPEEQPLTRATDRAEPSHRRFLLTGLDGVARVIEGVAFPLVSRESGMMGAAGIFWDVREREATPPSLARDGNPPSRTRHAVEVILLRRLADRLLMPIFVTDAEATCSSQPGGRPADRATLRCAGPVRCRSGTTVPADRRGRLPIRSTTTH